MNRLCVGVCLLALSLCGCDTGRINGLEKENANLKAQIEKENVARDYDLQVKCSKDARAFFNENWGRDKDTIFLDFTNHYNGKLNKCFILAEYHFNSHLAGPHGDSWSNIMSLFDVYENMKYAEFGENHYTYFKPEIRNSQEMIMCEVAGTKCNSQQEFSNLVGPYLSN